MFSFFNSSEAQGNSTGSNNEGIFLLSSAGVLSLAGMGLYLWSTIKNSKKENALTQQTITELQEILGLAKEQCKLQRQINAFNEKLYWVLRDDRSQAQEILDKLTSLEQQCQKLPFAIFQDTSSYNAQELCDLIAEENNKLSGLIDTASEQGMRNRELMRKQEEEINTLSNLQLK